MVIKVQPRQIQKSTEWVTCVQNNVQLHSIATGMPKLF